MLINFTCKDFSAKSWNYCSHFGAFTKSKQNKTLSLEDSQLNRLPDYCIRIFYLIDDIASYLKKYSDILDDVAIIDCSFVEIEILKQLLLKLLY